jgi:hypothetical protein
VSDEGAEAYLRQVAEAALRHCSSLPTTFEGGGLWAGYGLTGPARGFMSEPSGICARFVSWGQQELRTNQGGRAASGAAGAAVNPEMGSGPFRSPPAVRRSAPG